MVNTQFNFEKFKSPGGRFNSYSISLNNAGGFSFSSGFCRKHDTKNYPYVIFYYDKRSKAVGFVFSKQPAEGAFKLTITSNSTVSVRPNSFIAAYEIKPEVFAGKYKPQKTRSDDGKELYYITLEKKSK